MNQKVLRDISYGMYIVTGNNDNKLFGCTINTLTQISSNNLISISINKENNTNIELRKTNKLAINIIGNNTNQDIINTFGFSSSKDKNKFENLEYTIIDNMPIINNACSYLICEIENIVDAETHDLFLCKIVASDKLSDDIPMTYKYYREVKNGKSPKKAPTYIKEIKKSGYECMMCGYIYEGDFAKLPEDWVCPICGATKDMFEKK